MQAVRVGGSDAAKYRYTGQFLADESTEGILASGSIALEVSDAGAVTGIGYKELVYSQWGRFRHNVHRQNTRI